jgi:hypothetical protein
MRKYIVTTPAVTGDLTFEYDATGILVSFHNNAELKEEHCKWLYRHFPFVDDELPHTFPKSKITEVTDLTFERFWREYDMKVGNKTRTEKLWNALPEADRMQVFERLPKYRRHLKLHQGIMQAYPETFLSQRRWENEYK